MAITVKPGDKFGRFTLVMPDTSRAKASPMRSYWICDCECGARKSVQLQTLVYGKSHSCGCLALELVTKHGMTGTPLMFAYTAMKQRCLNPKCPNYKNYGARGITVCARWLESFENFYADMGNRPEGMSLERVDNSKGYSPDNCKWASRIEQNNNMRTNRFLEYNGQRLTVSQWARQLGIRKSQIFDRLRDNRSVEWALFGVKTPSNNLAA